MTVRPEDLRKPAGGFGTLEYQTPVYRSGLETTLWERRIWVLSGLSATLPFVFVVLDAGQPHGTVVRYRGGPLSKRHPETKGPVDW